MREPYPTIGVIVEELGREGSVIFNEISHSFLGHFVSSYVQLYILDLLRVQDHLNFLLTLFDLCITTVRVCKAKELCQMVAKLHSQDCPFMVIEKTQTHYQYTYM